MKYAIIFPGQGAQSVGMMVGFAESEIVRDTFNTAQKVLGVDFWDKQQNASAEELAQTTITQPLLLTAGVAVYRHWQWQCAFAPFVGAGHSLGEYCALVAAQAMSFETALEVVNKRAQLMEKAAEQGSGAMAAILGTSEEIILSACSQATVINDKTTEIVTPVNYNSPEQIVIAGHKVAVERCCEILKAQGVKRTIMLPVSGAFHSPLMKPASEAMKEVLKLAQITPPQFPIIHNADLKSHNNPDDIRSALAKQVATPVRWVDTVNAIVAMGIKQTIESSPSKTLAGLNRRINSEVNTVSLMNISVITEAVKN